MKIEVKSEETIKDSHIVQIFLFRGEDYLGWDCFNKDSIAIGRSSTADLILDDESIAAFQAIIFCNNGEISVELFESKSNRKTTVRPGQFDSIEIGPFTLKIKLKGVSSQIKLKENTVQERPENDKNSQYIQDQVKPDQDTLNQDIWDQVIPEQNTPEPNTIESTAEEQTGETKPPSPQPITEIHAHLKSDDAESSDFVHENKAIKEDPSEDVEETMVADTGDDQPEAIGTENSSEEVQHPEENENDTSFDSFDWEDEEEEEDVEALFSLREKVIEQSDQALSSGNAYSGEMLIEVIKSKYDKVCDVSFLSGSQKYIIENNKRFCLAENKKGAGQFVYFQGHHKGTVYPDKSTQHALETLRTPDNIFHKRKGIYRYQLPKNSVVVLQDGPCEYRIKSVQPGVSPAVQETVKNNNAFFKNLVKSSVLHLFFLVFVGLFPGFEPPEQPIESHFVRIDADEMAKIQKTIQPKPPKKVAPPKKATPKPAVIKKAKPVAKKSTKTKRQVVSRHPKAGGGFGKGNIKNRNVNQTGILSMLGSSVGLKPGEAMAAVSNLDAVSNSVNTRGNFKISGITGKLGNGGIEMPKSDIVSTKGSHQVLRSAGAGGKGRVAALKKGRTGDNQVMAMVTASLNKKVKIQGGMSREAVKKVIDMHMDEISHCYETALVDNPSIVGRVVFEWKILLSGKVGEVRIKNSSINSDYIHSCIQSRIKSWQFPKPQGSEVMVSYPFIFDIVGF